MIDAPRSGRAPGADPEDGFLRQTGRQFLLSLYAAMRSLKFYPVENDAVQNALSEHEEVAAQLLERGGEIEVRLSGDFIFVNGTRLRLELDNYAAFGGILGTLRGFDIGRMRIHEGIARKDWQAFLSLLLSLGTIEEAEERYFTLIERLLQAEVKAIELVQASHEHDQDEEAHSREVAKRTYSQGVAVTKEVLNSIRLGRTANIRKVKRAVQMIVDQVLTNETSIIGLTTLRDYDEYTFTHSVNVCIFSVALGRKIGFTKLQLYDLGMAALLHDVGKARVPVEILNKTANLTEADWRAIQTHPWRGAVTLFGMRGYEGVPYRSILVAHEHHMKTDLTGYPRHVRPRTLGVYSRLVAVADGFDAATTRRAYQATPLEPDQVLREMWENPKRGYDAIMVKALINLIGVYPVGTCVILDTFEVGVVASLNPDRQQLNRPSVRVVLTPDGGMVPPPGTLVDLSERTPDGGFARSIVKVTNPDRYGIVVGDYFL
ncbi:MAG TPA: HD domain-containing phosphohydrolase [Gemmatimonadales bacterium]|nr:HD domain-containing phosphohydrolase [Gemmatimonadales bacterium]